MKIYVAKLDDDDSIEIFPNAIKDIDPNDIVHVVRCKDCKYCFVDGDDDWRYNVCDLSHNKVQRDDWYCADGERRDDDGTD